MTSFLCNTICNINCITQTYILNSKSMYFILAINTFASQAVRGVTRLSDESMIQET